MNIKDIVNRDIVNLTNCEQEPIHIPGSIQPHGFLIAIIKDSYIIEYCSGNISDYTGVNYTDILGKKFEEVFGQESLASLMSYIEKGQMLSSTLLKLTLAEHDFVCTIHEQDNMYIIEAEPASIAHKDPSYEYDQTKQFLDYMHDTHTLKELCQLVTKGISDITGYDRVMVYRFDKDYNGEVFAETKRDNLEPFLGLHYPHTDIPKQARELYMQNLLRVITDIDYTPVPIYTIDNGKNKNLDLSLSILRSTSPIHVEYLQNMGVGATLTISLLHQKKLWGLIACHHYSSKNLSPDLRLAAQLQGHFITSQIELRQKSEEYQLSQKIAVALEKANSVFIETEASFNSLIQLPELKQLCNASGVSIVFNSKIYKNGHTPEDEEIKQLIKKLPLFADNGNLHTDKIASLLPEFESSCQNFSGIIYHSLDLESNNFIIWYRPENVKEVHWGGDPNKSIIKNEKGLSPRNSFELWKEIVNCQSRPWMKPEIDMAASFAYSLQKQINLLIITQEEERYRKLSELLKETNSELENINWISTHDLQEPLRKIQLVSSRLIATEKNITPKVQEAVERMNNSANRMQNLLIDILKYTRLRHLDHEPELVDLSSLVNEVKGELADTIEYKNAKLDIDKLPKIKGMPFLLKQLFANLISNSVKYASPNRKPEIKVSAEPQPVHISREDKTLYHLIYVADNGIGFEQEYAESIFNIFTRLHTGIQYKGSGVGLALCKKIMQNHDGHITASGKTDEGSVISLYFPVESR